MQIKKKIILILVGRQSVAYMIWWSGASGGKPSVVILNIYSTTIQLFQSLRYIQLLPTNICIESQCVFKYLRFVYSSGLKLAFHGPHAASEPLLMWPVVQINFIYHFFLIYYLNGQQLYLFEHLNIIKVLLFIIFNKIIFWMNGKKYIQGVPMGFIQCGISWVNFKYSYPVF